MKKIILAIALFAAVNAHAQSDGFFAYNNFEQSRQGSDAWDITPALMNHGEKENQDAAPLGSGLLILGGMAVLYASRKKSN